MLFTAVSGHHLMPDRCIYWFLGKTDKCSICVCVCVQVMGSLADKKCAQGQRVSGILVKRNFSYHILTPSDLSCELVHFSLWLIGTHLAQHVFHSFFFAF